MYCSQTWISLRAGLWYIPREAIEAGNDIAEVVARELEE